MKEVWQKTKVSPDYEVSNLGNLRSTATKNPIQPLRNYKSERYYQLKVPTLHLKEILDKLPFKKEDYLESYDDLGFWISLRDPNTIQYLRLPARVLVAIAHVPPLKECKFDWSVGRLSHYPVPINSDQPWHYAHNIRWVRSDKIKKAFLYRVRTYLRKKGRARTDYSPVYDNIIDAIYEADNPKHQITAKELSYKLNLSYPYLQQRLSELLRLGRISRRAEWPDATNNDNHTLEEYGRKPWQYFIADNMPLHVAKTYDIQFDPIECDYEKASEIAKEDEENEENEENEEEIYGTDEEIEEQIRNAQIAAKKRIKRMQLESLIEEL